MAKKHGKKHGHDGSKKARARPATADWAISAEASGGLHEPASAQGEPALPAPVPGSAVCRAGAPCRLSEIDPDSTGPYRDKAEVAEALKVERRRIRDLQERLYAERRQSLLVVLQAIDTGGKDGTIRHVFEGVNPQGCEVRSFKVPSQEEMDHDFLWRYHKATPARGMITLFNRSHYEDVLVVRVKNLVPEPVWRQRYALINDFERLLAASGTTVLKFFLHISKAEQKRRLEARLAEPDKHWKFDRADLVERESWDDYQAAFEDALNACSPPAAPWHVVPANHKWFRNLVVARTIADTLAAMDPQFPEPQEGLAHVKVPD
jgi:PPK2 family polyphosphate:nucleotide phosphotransferase